MAKTPRVAGSGTGGPPLPSVLNVKVKNFLSIHALFKFGPDGTSA